MTQFWLGLLATVLVVIVGMFAFEQMTDTLRAMKLGARAYWVADKAYDLLLIPVARIGKASGHPSYFHTAKHLRGA